MKKLVMCLVFMYSISAFAFRLTPMTMDFDSKGRGSTQTFQVINNGDKEIALEVDTAVRKISGLNVEKREPTKDFVVYPLQMKVAPNEKKNIRVTYVGEEPKNEVAYRLIVRQLPINLEKKKTDKSQINFLFEYIAALYVKGKETKAGAVELKRIVKKGSELEVTMVNSGSTHCFLKDFKAVITDTSGKTDLDLNEKEYEAIGGVNLLTNSEIQVMIPIPAKVTGKVSKVHFVKK